MVEIQEEEYWSGSPEGLSRKQSPAIKVFMCVSSPELILYIFPDPLSIYRVAVVAVVVVVYCILKDRLRGEK